MDVKLYIEYVYQDIEIKQANFASRISDTLTFLKNENKIAKLKKVLWIIITSEYKRFVFIKNLINNKLEN